jgi:hypothetical protein
VSVINHQSKSRTRPQSRSQYKTLETYRNKPGHDLLTSTSLTSLSCSGSREYRNVVLTCRAGATSWSSTPRDGGRVFSASSAWTVWVEMEVVDGGMPRVGVGGYGAVLIRRFVRCSYVSETMGFQVWAVVAGPRIPKGLV